MQSPVYNQQGEEIGTMELPAHLFEVAFNADTVHSVMLAQEANARHSIAHTKGRGEVRGGGKKPWRQKGTGRARHASIRSPIWKGGGVAFGPTKERNFSQKVNKKLARTALAMVLSSKVHDGEFKVVEGMQFEDSKTKFAAATLKKLAPSSRSVLVVTPKKNESLDRAMRNLKTSGVIAADSLNVRDILATQYVIVLKDAIGVMSSHFKA
ncbi:MAG: 50S ribosomal protein L4 [Patescibacteria group bacterium]